MALHALITLILVLFLQCQQRMSSVPDGNFTAILPYGWRVMTCPASVQGAALDVFSALANAKSLRHLNLYRDSGLTGPLVPPLAPLQGGLCQLARRSLNTLTADGVQLTGGIPSCLINNGSRLVELHLGVPPGIDLHLRPRFCPYCSNAKAVHNVPKFSHCQALAFTGQAKLSGLILPVSWRLRDISGPCQWASGPDMTALCCPRYRCSVAGC